MTTEQVSQVYEPALTRALVWLAATHILTYDDLRRIAWPPAADRRQISRERLAWERADYIRPLRSDGALYVLSAAGARLLGSLGIAAATPARYTSGLPGLIFASRFAVELAHELAGEANVAGLSWENNAHAGRVARADGDGIIWFRTEDTCASASRPPALIPWPNKGQPLPAPARRHIFLEFDSSTETADDLAIRAANWSRRGASDPVFTVSGGNKPLFLWVLDDSAPRRSTRTIERRLGLIRSAWQMTGLPALYISASLLERDTMLRPWTSLWLDGNGQRTSLRQIILGGPPPAR